MAKKDAKEYFLSIERQYNEIKEQLEDVNECYANGELTEVDAKNALTEFEQAQLIYDTAKIFMHHLNKRKRW